MNKGIYIKFDRKSVGLIFLGIGLTMFILNMTTIISLLPYLSQMSYSSTGFNSLSGYYVSVISSIILIVYSIYNINFE